MPSPVYAEQYTTDYALEHALSEAAGRHGVSLDADRLGHLVDIADTLETIGGQSLGADTDIGFTDGQNGAMASRATYSNRFGTTAAKIDFMPPNEEDDLSIGAMDASPENVSQFTLMAIHALQNYVLLAEVGRVKKPAILYGDTNPEMAIVAERFGLYSDEARHNADRNAAHQVMRKMDRVAVYGSFDEMSQRAFSDDVLQLERMLTHRIAARQHVGDVALG